jgi:hypothetical protein
MNENGNDKDQEGSPLELVIQRLVEQQTVEAAEAARGVPEDLVHGWKQTQHPPTLGQLHAGLLSVSQIAEAAIELGVGISADIREILPTLQQVSTQLQAFSVELRSVQDTLMTFKRDIQSLKEDTRDMADTVRSIPGIKLMLTEILTRLPPEA